MNNLLICILGNTGAGKTLLLVYFSTKIKRQIQSNFNIKIANYNKLKLVDLINLPTNSDIFIDEAYTWVESRVSSKHLNRYLSYIVFQSRKRTIDIYITAQMFSTIDKRFRHQSDILISCQNIKNKGFKYRIFNRRNNSLSEFILPFKKAEKLYKLYDTYQIIEPYEQSKLEFTLLQSDTELLYKKSKKIAKFLKNKVKKITHNSVKLALFSNNFDKNFEPYVYMYLKEKMV